VLQGGGAGWIQPGAGDEKYRELGAGCASDQQSCLNIYALPPAEN
jgi:hypothetical protein